MTRAPEAFIAAVLAYCFEHVGSEGCADIMDLAREHGCAVDVKVTAEDIACDAEMQTWGALLPGDGWTRVVPPRTPEARTPAEAKVELDKLRLFAIMIADTDP